jgi:4-hydroxy-4-methyl-2-oxoglutarate aldolase
MKRHDPALTTRSTSSACVPNWLTAAARLPTATLHEAGRKIGALPSAIKPVAPRFRFAGLP